MERATMAARTLGETEATSECWREAWNLTKVLTCSFASRPAPIGDDLWDFGTVRNVQPRGGTLRKSQAVAASQAPPSQHPSTRPNYAGQPASGVRSHDYATGPAPSPQAQRAPSHPPQPQQYRQAHQPSVSFDTVRLQQRPPAAPPSAPPEYSAFSSSPSVPDQERARVELDRQRQRIEEEQRRQREHGHGERTATSGSSGSEGDGSIMHTVVLPVIDSVSLVALLSDQS